MSERKNNKWLKTKQSQEVEDWFSMAFVITFFMKQAWILIEVLTDWLTNNSKSLLWICIAPEVIRRM